MKYNIKTYSILFFIGITFLYSCRSSTYYLDSKLPKKENSSSYLIPYENKNLFIYDNKIGKGSHGKYIKVPTFEISVAKKIISISSNNLNEILVEFDRKQYVYINLINDNPHNETLQFSDLKTNKKNVLFGKEIFLDNKVRSFNSRLNHLLQNDYVKIHLINIDKNNSEEFLSLSRTFKFVN